MNKWLPLLFVLSANTYAADNSLTGSYFREFSDTSGQADIVVSQRNQSWGVVAFGAFLPATKLTTKELNVLWKRMNWAVTANKTTECLKFDMQDICYVSPEANAKNEEGTAIAVGYYYYDPLVGITKLSKTAL
jgi:hypothetical protein